MENGKVEDGYRIAYLREHISAMKDAVLIDGVELLGYTTWGCIDLVSASTGESPTNWQSYSPWGIKNVAVKESSAERTSAGDFYANWICTEEPYGSSS